MKKNAPKILAVVLLSTIAVLMVLAGTKGIGGLLGDSGREVPSGSASDEVVGGDEAKPPEEVYEPQEIEDVVFFPVAPEASALYAYTQTLWSPTGMSLDGVVQTSEYVYVIITHSSDSGALKTDGRRISVVQMSTDGTLNAVIHLPARTDGVKFLTAKLTAAGIVVVGEDGERSYVYTISTDLKNAELMELPRFNEATVFSLTEGYLLIGAGTTDVIYKINGNAVLASTSLGAGAVVDLYDFGSYYTLILNGISGYSIVKIGNDLRHISTICVSARQLLAIRPIAHKGEQKFLVAEKSDTGVELVRYNADFRAAEAERVGVGLADGAEVFMNGQSTFALLHSTTDRLYVIDSNLDFTASSSGIFGGITALYDYALYDSGFCALYACGETLTLTDVRNDATSETRNVAVRTDKARLLLTADGKRIIVYAAENGVKILGL